MTTQSTTQFGLDQLHQMVQDNQQDQAPTFLTAWLEFRVEPQEYLDDAGEIIQVTYSDGSPKLRLVVEKMTHNGKFTSDQYNGFPYGPRSLSHMSQLYTFLEYLLTNIGPMNQVSSLAGWEAMLENLNATYVGAWVQEKRLERFQPAVGGKPVTISRPKMENNQQVLGPDGKVVYQEEPVTFKSITLPFSTTGRLSEEDLDAAMVRFRQWADGGRLKQGQADTPSDGKVSLKDIAGHINGKTVEQAVEFLSLIPAERFDNQVALAARDDGTFLERLQKAKYLTIKDGVIHSR